jgi:SpoVK/Ycf46/Vps4 family AAA+-type ATPase
LLVGPPGTGKTFSAKVCATKLGFPLINIGIDQVISGGVDKFKQLLNRVEAAAPAVVYFDEFDKFFAVDGGGNTQAEQQSVLGILLTWLQEKQSETFVIASLNRLDALPPEITRAGRFDKLFYCGFPQSNERVEILKIHCGRFDRRWIDSPLNLEQWRILLQKTQNCTGAELRAIAENAARQLFREGKPLEIELEHLLEQRALMTPLYYRDIDRILAIENRAKGISEPASSPDLSQYAPPSVSLWGEHIN